MTFRFTGLRSTIAALTLVTAMNTTPSHAVTAEDAQEILRLAVTTPRVLKYVKLGEPGTPLRVANASAVDFGGAAFAIDGHPVEMVSSATADRSTIEIIQADLQPARASLTFRYRRQGIQVDASFARAAGRWAVENLKLVEH